MNALSHSQVCSYEGSLLPFAAEGRPKKLYYGGLSSEISNEKSLLYSFPEQCLV